MKAATKLSQSIVEQCLVIGSGWLGVHNNFLQTNRSTHTHNWHTTIINVINIEKLQIVICCLQIPEKTTTLCFVA